MLPGVGTVIGNDGFGAMLCFQLLQRIHITICPFICIPRRSAVMMGYHPYLQSVTFSICFPICQANHYWNHWRYEVKKMRHKFRCIFISRGMECPDHLAFLQCNSKKSAYGPSFYLETNDDILLFRPVPRNSDPFKQTFKRCSGVERTFKRIFEDHQVEAHRSRSCAVRFSLAILAAIIMHLDARIQHPELISVDIQIKSAAV